MGKKAAIIITSITFSVLLITAIVLISVSFEITDVNETAIVNDMFNMEVRYDSNFAEPGRHFTGLT